MRFINKVKRYNITFRLLNPVIVISQRVRNYIVGKMYFHKNRRKYKKLLREGACENKNFKANIVYDLPALYDRFSEAGSVSTYFWQDLWAARLIAKQCPEVHYDIGSRVDGFIGHLASFRDNVVLIDVRPMESVIPGVTFIQANATNLDGIPDNSIESLSALCSLEHFGLGRYGDEVDPDSWYKAMKSIVRVVKEGGRAYISVPIGQEHLEFDSHRVFKAETIVNTFLPMRLVSFSATKYGDNNLYEDVDIHMFDENLGERCTVFGLFCFEKKIRENDYEL